MSKLELKDLVATPKISKQQKALVAVFQAAARLRRQAGGIFHEEGLSAAQYNVLRILRGAAGSLPIMTIRDRMIFREPSITRLIDRLEKQKLVERRPSKEDRRRVDCTLTTSGLAVVNSLDEPTDRMDRELMSRLNVRELRTLTTLLEKVGFDE